MACNSCGQTSNACGCKDTCNPLASNWLIPVKSVPPVEMASRRFAYITPDDSVWVMKFDGTDMIRIGDTPDIVDATEALPEMDKADKFKLYRQDDRLVMINSARTEWITVV